jgi:hypothetical protein
LHNLRVDELEAAVRAISNEANSANCSRILISSEEFTNSLWDAKINFEIIDEFMRIFGEGSVEIIFFVRNIYDYVESVFAQFIRAGMFRVNFEEFFSDRLFSLSDFIDFFYKNNGFYFFDYSVFMLPYIREVGVSRVNVYSTEREDLAGDDVISRLCKSLQVPFLDFKSEVRVNAKSSLRSLVGMLYASSIFGQEAILGKGHLFSEILPGSVYETNTALQVSDDTFRLIRYFSDQLRNFFSEKFNGSFAKVFEEPPGYPRISENDIFLTEGERVAVCYLAGSPAPKVRLAKQFCKENTAASSICRPSEVLAVGRLEARVTALESAFQRVLSTD